MNILVIGETGQVARALVERASDRDNVTALGRPELDLTKKASVVSAVNKVRPDIIVNAAAYTAVDKAESDEDAAYLVNQDGPAVLAELCNSLSIPLVHYSTDYVFDGTAQNAYAEDAAPQPLGVYGRSKLAGEKAVADRLENHVVFRTAWVYSPFGNNFVKTMLRLASDRDVISVVEDQFGCPTSALDIADATLEVARQMVGGNIKPGIYHMCGQNDTNWYGFAKAIFEASEEFGGPSAKVEPIPSSQFPTPAKRPKNSRLNSAKLLNEYGVQLPDWRASTRACVRRILNERSAP
ncbi:dTDP-4-dehydrorhamnose reductase [Henriciella litoralis]|uniref:dTDP-4-dehydrorhamnose reductase n=1 Tax=Henriciella litoralis TaxID=568102 RepID=UPI000A02AC73|nr:dTDP-4-dehydrorhamnose reductase [Henriciella litoralis]